MRAPLIHALGKRIAMTKRNTIKTLALTISALLSAIRSETSESTVEKSGGLFGRVMLFGNKMVVHRDKPKALEFFSIPPNHEVLCSEDGQEPYRNQREKYALGGACWVIFCPTEEISTAPPKPEVSDVVPLLKCGAPTTPIPTSSRKLQDWVVVKTPTRINLTAPFFLAGTEYRGRGEGGPVTPRFPFFQVISVDGEVLFEVNEKSTPPAKVVTGLGAIQSGVLFGVGEFVSFFNGCDGETSPRKIRKFILWEPPNRVREIDSRSETDEVRAIMARFRVYEELMPWYKPKPGEE